MVRCLHMRRRLHGFAIDGGHFSRAWRYPRGARRLVRDDRETAGGVAISLTPVSRGERNPCH
jgi:hypothetical protein